MPAKKLSELTLPQRVIAVTFIVAFLVIVSLAMVIAILYLADWLVAVYGRVA